MINPQVNPRCPFKTKDKTNAVLDELIEMARQLGASDAVAVSADDISAEEELARLCREPRCPNYGLSLSCPPHVSGPVELREYMQGVKYAVFVKIDLPDQTLHMDEQREIGQLLHEMVAAMEQRAKEKGFTKSRAFAGGSCKNIFCHQHADCRVLEGDGKCRNPDKARPSMSGFGINVLKLMKAAGWAKDDSARAANPVGTSQITLCGLVLVG